MLNSCSWIGALRNLNSHCEIRIPWDPVHAIWPVHLFMRKHQDVDCPMRPEPCPHCKNDVPVQQMQAHLEKVCLEVYHACLNQCYRWNYLRLKDIWLWKEETVLLLRWTVPLKSILSLSKNPNTKNSIQCTMLRPRPSVSWNSNRKKRKMQTLSNGRIKSLEGQTVNSTMMFHKSKTPRWSTCLMTLWYLLHHWPTHKLEFRLRKWSSCYAKSRCTSEVHVMQSLGGPSPLPTDTDGMAPQQIETFHAKILNLDHRLEQVQSIDQELRLQLTERASDNGILIWNADEFERRQKEAMEGMTLSLSTPLLCLQMGTGTKCAPGPTWMEVDWSFISVFFFFS